MLRLMYTAIKYFSLGLLLGLLTAPRSGAQSRQMLRENGMSAARELLPTLRGQESPQGPGRAR